MKRTLIQNAVVVNEGRKVLGSVVIENEKIAEILVGEENATAPCDEIIDATGCYLLPGAIDEHVHFREEFQTPDGEALRQDDKYMYVSCWEYQGEDKDPVMYKEELKYEAIKVQQRNYKQ